MTANARKHFQTGAIFLIGVTKGNEVKQALRIFTYYSNARSPCAPRVQGCSDSHVSSEFLERRNWDDDRDPLVSA